MFFPVPATSSIKLNGSQDSSRGNSTNRLLESAHSLDTFSLKRVTIDLLFSFHAVTIICYVKPKFFSII